MRKFALLFAFVLVLTCAGGAFAGNANLDVVDIKANTLNPGSSPTFVAAVKGVATTETITIVNTTAQNPTPEQKLMTGADYQGIYALLTAHDATLNVANGSDTFTIILGTHQYEIPDGAFKGFEGLSVTAAAANGGANAGAIIKIGDSAFEDTKRLGVLTNIFLNATNAQDLESIGKNAFKNSRFVAPANVGTISGAGFKTLGEGAFMESNITAFTLASLLCDAIPKDAFNGCDTLATVTLPKTIKTIGESAFQGCEALTTPGVAMIPTGSALTTIGASAFRGSKNMTEFDFDYAGELLTIGDNAFRDCEKLTTLSNLAKGSVTARPGAKKLTTIGEYAFSKTGLGGSAAVKIINFPSTLKNIGKGAFGYYSVFSVNNGPEIIFRSGTTKAEDTILVTAIDVREFLEKLTIGGAFADSVWPITGIGRNTIKMNMQSCLKGTLKKRRQPE